MKKSTTIGYEKKGAKRSIINKTLVRFCAWVLFCDAVLTISAAPSPNEEELSNTRHCKALCNQCGGLGFYCGEECICECNDDRSDTECIARLQRDANHLNLPFDILIQGPEKNSFLRNALQFEQDADHGATSVMSPARNKRSTVVVYKPSTRNSLNEQCEQSPTATINSNVDYSKKSIKKRSVNQFDWLNDLTNAFLRPAPKRVQRKNNEPAYKSESSQEVAKSQPKKFNPSWFKDSARFLLQPAPLYRRQADNDNTRTNGDEDIMAKFPEMLKETINKIQAAGINDEFGQALRSRILEGTEALQSQLQSKNFNRFLRDAVSETLKRLRAAAMVQDEGTDSQESESQGDF